MLKSAAIASIDFPSFHNRHSVGLLSSCRVPRRSDASHPQNQPDRVVANAVPFG